ncbi:MAG: hypothetical protein ACR2MP_05695, partial [Streptosporangiaceae bacterium]
GTDSAGRRTSAGDPLGNTWNFSPDLRNLNTQTQAPPPKAGAPRPTSSAVYDPVGNQTSATDPDANTTHWGYTPRNTLGSVCDATNGQSTCPLSRAGSGWTGYGWDPTSNLQSAANANGQSTG